MKVSIKEILEVKTELMLEEAIECFGREFVCKAVENHSRFIHNYELRTAYAKENGMPSSVEGIKKLREFVEDNKLELKVI